VILTADHVDTDRLTLTHPVTTDVAALHKICSDRRVWTHFPSLRHTDLAQTAAMVERWQRSWAADGLGTWVVRRPGDPAVLGYGGCTVLGGAVWNLGYRFAPEAQGKGLATEVAQEALTQARATRPELPVIAYLLEHNTASRRTAERVGLVLRHRAPDAGNPDPRAVRLVLADRPLDDAQLAVTLA
jgi:RimJ/RimL family protein N-acetyltransferase